MSDTKIASPLAVHLNLNLAGLKANSPALNKQTPKKNHKSLSMSLLPTKFEEEVKAKELRLQAKLNSLRLLKQAEDRKNVTGIPEINKKSRILAKNQHKEKIEPKKKQEGTEIEIKTVKNSDMKLN